MHWIICPTRNNLQLLQRAIETFRRQDVGDIHILVINNGSTDGTSEWLRTQHDLFTIHVPGYGWSVAKSWNRGLTFVFDELGKDCEDHALVVNNDVELRPDTYRWLLADGGVFVTAVGVRDPEKIKHFTLRTDQALAPDEARCTLCGATVTRDWELIGHDCPAPPPGLKSPHPDFSCFLIRRDCYKLVGAFDENFKVAFCEDWDYHVRMHKAGIRAESLALPYLHHASQTIKNASNEDRDRIQKQADWNREYFFRKWGVRGGTDEYYALFNQSTTANEEV